MRLGPRIAELFAKIFLFGITLFIVGILLFIILFILKNGAAHISWKFITMPIEDMGRSGGILATIVGTGLIVLVAIVVATPLGVSSAIYLAEYTKGGRITEVIRFGINCLSAVPSIIFGLFGFILFVETLGFGWSILSGGLSLAAMVLPTIISTSEEALRSVPISYREVARSLGATRWQTVSKAVIPYALPGILTGIILSIGRAVGETAVVIFTAGTATQMPRSLLDSARTMAVHFYVLAREGISLDNAYATATLLICTTLIVNASAYILMHRLMRGRR
jgi:phosphate transport system permease protein